MMMSSALNSGSLPDALNKSVMANECLRILRHRPTVIAATLGRSPVRSRGLDLRFLVHAQHGRVLRRRQIQADLATSCGSVENLNASDRTAGSRSPATPRDRGVAEFELARRRHDRTVLYRPRSD
jgi:hypothetical protein